MERVLPYLLLILVLVATLDESLKTRYYRLIGQPVQADSQPAAAPTPFWQSPGYRTGLDKADEKLERKNTSKRALNKSQAL